MTDRPPDRAEEDAVLSTVAYASLFDYPLTLEQLRTGLLRVAVDEPTLVAWLDRSPRLLDRLERHDGFVMFRGSRHLVELRRTRERRTQALLARGRPALLSLVAMPYVRTVALSGSIAHGNADEDADLDLFVITAPGRAWLVMVAAVVAARLGGWRRLLCLNYIVSERGLAVTPMDLFAANQIAHLCPVVDRGGAYARFLASNPFVGDFYPNVTPRVARVDVGVPGWAAALTRASEGVLDWTVAPLLERVCRWLYGGHLQRRASSWSSGHQVRLDAECLKLHTSSHREDVLRRFDDLLRSLEADEASMMAGGARRVVGSAR